MSHEQSLVIESVILIKVTVVPYEIYNNFSDDGCYRLIFTDFYANFVIALLEQFLFQLTYKTDVIFDICDCICDSSINTLVC